MNANGAPGPFFYPLEVLTLSEINLRLDIFVQQKQVQTGFLGQTRHRYPSGSNIKLTQRELQTEGSRELKISF